MQAICKNLRNNEIKIIYTKLKKVLNILLLFPGGLLQEHRIETLIDSFYQLSEAVEKAQSFFDNQLFATITCSFINNTTTLFYFLNSINNIKQSGQLKGYVMQGAWVFSHFTHMTSLFSPSTSLTDAVSFSLPRHPSGLTVPPLKLVI